jgi:4a-hydroxytetrahydrobiopterin dehydratase
METMELAQKKCSTYKPGSPPITRKDVFELLKEVPDWILAEGHLSRTFAFEDSSQSIEFINDVLALSVQEGHIPDISLTEGKVVEVGYYTYQAGGLTLNDFIMAAKINERDYTD